MIVNYCKVVSFLEFSFDISSSKYILVKTGTDDAEIFLFQYLNFQFPEIKLDLYTLWLHSK